MRILVTGGAGFIGSHLVDSLVKEGHEILVIDDLSTGKKEYVNKQARLEILDVVDKKSAKVVANFSPDIVYHLAAQKNVRVSLEDPVLDARTNILGSLNLLNQAIKSQVKKFIFVSTCGIYGDTNNLPTDELAEVKPLSPYILNKLTIEKYLHILCQDKIKWAAPRLANVYGPRQDPYGEAGVIAILLDDAVNNKTFYINGDGQQTRDYIYVEDVVQALLAFMDTAEGIYNIGTGVETSLLDLIDTVSSISSQSLNIQHREAIKGEVPRSCLKCQKAAKELKWQADYDLRQGLDLTYRWFKEKD